MKRIVQRMSDGTSRFKDITHRQYLKKKGYSDKEIKEIEKKDISRGAKPGDMDKQMWKSVSVYDADSKQVLEKELSRLDKEITQALSQKKDITSIHKKRMVVLKELSKTR